MCLKNKKHLRSKGIHNEGLKVSQVASGWQVHYLVDPASNQHNCTYSIELLTIWIKTLAKAPGTFSFDTHTHTRTHSGLWSNVRWTAGMIPYAFSANEQSIYILVFCIPHNNPPMAWSAPGPSTQLASYLPRRSKLHILLFSFPQRP